MVTAIRVLFGLAMIVALVGPPIYLAQSRQTWMDFLRSILLVWIPGSVVEVIINLTMDVPFLHVTWIFTGWQFGLVYCYFWYCVIRMSSGGVSSPQGDESSFAPPVSHK
jgi:hypothetical protein